MAGKKGRVKLKIGPQTSTFELGVFTNKMSQDAEGNLSPNQLNFGDSILKFMLARLNLEKRVNRPKLKEKLKETIRHQYIRGIYFASQRWIGFQGPNNRTMKTLPALGNMADEANGHTFWKGAAPKKPNLGSLQWLGLSHETARIKAQRLKDLRAATGKRANNKQISADAYKFFTHTGKLRNYLRDNAESIVNKTGVVSVTANEYYKPTNAWDRSGPSPVRKYKGHGKQKVPIGNIKIRLLPSVTRTMLPGVVEGSIKNQINDQAFESLIIKDPGIREKLKGKMAHSDGRGYRIQRNMLQPIFTYWTLFYMPMHIATHLNKLLGQKGE